MTRAEIDKGLEDLRAFGFPEAEIEKARTEAVRRWQEAESADFVVHPENVAAVRLALVCSTQWRTASLSTMGRAAIVRTGLDYGVVPLTAQLAGLAEVTADTFHRLRVMEAEAMTAWHEDREAAQ